MPEQRAVSSAKHTVSREKLQYGCLLFDLDGVLADTREWVVSAFQETSSRYGLEVRDAQLNDLFGRSLEESYRLLAPGRQHDFLINAHRSFQQKHPELIRPFPGVVEVLEWIEGNEIPMAIVSGRRHASAAVTMDLLGLSRFFNVVIGGDDTLKQKPDPEPLFAALERLSRKPSEALMVGDAPADLTGGIRAGCETCAALYGFVGASLVDLRPTYTIDSINELPQIILR